MGKAQRVDTFVQSERRTDSADNTCLAVEAGALTQAVDSLDSGAVSAEEVTNAKLPLVGQLEVIQLSSTPCFSWVTSRPDWTEEPFQRFFRGHPSKPLKRLMRNTGTLLPPS
jgi:hypothetical protein